ASIIVVLIRCALMQRVMQLILFPKLVTVFVVAERPIRSVGVNDLRHSTHSGGYVGCLVPVRIKPVIILVSGWVAARVGLGLDTIRPWAASVVKIRCG